MAQMEGQERVGRVEAASDGPETRGTSVGGRSVNVLDPSMTT